ncbi:MAG: cyanophycin synthetase, partial [Myxococcota bacterium]
MTLHPVLMDGPGRAPSESSEAYRQLLERLYSLSRRGTKFGLERIRDLLRRLGHPERAFPTIHVAGSNGKGSTSAFLATILARSGRKVGLFTSPHLISLTERIQFLQGAGLRAISQEELLRAAAEVEAAEPGFGEVSFFEVLTALGLVAFRSADVDIAVIEAGLGARLDSTRVIEPEVAVLTDLSLEHTAILGDTIEAIAGEEGQVARPDRPLVMADGPRPAMRVMDRLAEDIGVEEVHRLGREVDLAAHPDGAFDLDLGSRTLERVRPALLGQHQGRNAVLAAKAALLVDPGLSDQTLREGLETTVWPGRMEIFHREGEPRILLDGAHNPHGARQFARALGHPRFAGPRHFVFGVLGDKNAPEMLEALAPRARSFALARPGSLRARDPDELVRLLGDGVGFEGPVTVAESPSEALAEAKRRA